MRTPPRWFSPLGTAARVQAQERAWTALGTFLKTCQSGPPRLEMLTPARGTCPACGYWNHPEATAYDRADLVYCNACGETWTPKETHGPEATQ